MNNLLRELVLEYCKNTKKNYSIDESLIKYLNKFISISQRTILPETLSTLSPIPIPTNSLSQTELKTFYFLLKISQLHPKKRIKISNLNIKKIALGINTDREQRRNTERSGENKYNDSNKSKEIKNNLNDLDRHVIERAMYYGKIYKELKYHTHPVTITHQYFYTAIEDILQMYENIVLSYNNDQPVLIFHTLMYVAYNRLETLNQICQCYKDNTEDSFSFLRYLNINLLTRPYYLYNYNDTFYNKLLSLTGVNNRYYNSNNNTPLDKNELLNGVNNKYYNANHNTPLDKNFYLTGVNNQSNILNNTPLTYISNYTFPPLNIILQKITLYTSIRTNTLLSSWLYTGTFIDPTSEFFITINSLENNTWHKYSINSKKVPYFLSSNCINNILYIGRCINLMKEVSKNKTSISSTSTENVNNCKSKFSNSNIPYPYCKDNNCESQCNNINILDTDFEENINKIILQINKRIWKEIFITANVLSFLYFLKDIFMFKRSDFVQNLFEMLKEWNVDKYGVSYKRSVGFILDTSLGVTFGNDCPFIKYMDVCLLEHSKGNSNIGGGVKGVNDKKCNLESVNNSTLADSDSLITNSNNTTLLENNNNINNTPLDNTWDYLTLLCVIDFPLNMIINKKAILRFSTIFKFLWKIKKVERILGSLKKRKLDKNSLNRIHFYYSFIQSFMFYCCEEVISTEWFSFLKLECFEENLYQISSKDCRCVNEDIKGDDNLDSKSAKNCTNEQWGVNTNTDGQHLFNNQSNEQQGFSNIYYAPSINNNTFMSTRLIESFKDGLLDLTSKIIDRGYMTGRMKEKLFLFFSELEALSLKVGRTGQPFDDFGVKKYLREFYIELGSKIENTGLFIYKKYL